MNPPPPSREIRLERFEDEEGPFAGDADELLSDDDVDTDLGSFGHVSLPSELSGLSVSEAVSFMKQICKFLPGNLKTKLIDKFAYFLLHFFLAFLTALQPGLQTGLLHGTARGFLERKVLGQIVVLVAHRQSPADLLAVIATLWKGKKGAINIPLITTTFFASFLFLVFFKRPLK